MTEQSKWRLQNIKNHLELAIEEFIDNDKEVPIEVLNKIVDLHVQLRKLPELE